MTAWTAAGADERYGSKLGMGGVSSKSAREQQARGTQGLGPRAL
jgi:hypothetical protein